MSSDGNSWIDELGWFGAIITVIAMIAFVGSFIAWIFLTLMYLFLAYKAYFQQDKFKHFEKKKQVMLAVAITRTVFFSTFFLYGWYYLIFLFGMKEGKAVAVIYSLIWFIFAGGFSALLTIGSWIRLKYQKALTGKLLEIGRAHV